MPWRPGVVPTRLRRVPENLHQDQGVGKGLAVWHDNFEAQLKSLERVESKGASQQDVVQAKSLWCGKRRSLQDLGSLPSKKVGY